MKDFQTARAPFLEGLAKLLETDGAAMTPEFELNDDNWDSLTLMSAIALIDECFDVTVPGSRLAGCGSVGELLSIVQSAVAQS